MDQDFLKETIDYPEFKE
ncbi:hypothetical protein PT115_09295 [Erysipelothrix rhusiopathiae]|nr:hypothetical protein [Erysipelothrix rhusiopathiae]MDE8209618.1 hypothetical protein [Erysipelothrix rhusiopathiae]